MSDRRCPLCRLEDDRATGRLRARLGRRPDLDELCRWHRPVGEQFEHIRLWNESVFANGKRPK